MLVKDIERVASATTEASERLRGVSTPGSAKQGPGLKAGMKARAQRMPVGMRAVLRCGMVRGRD